MRFRNRGVGGGIRTDKEGKWKVWTCTGVTGLGGERRGGGKRTEPGPMAVSTYVSNRIHAVLSRLVSIVACALALDQSSQ